jgi:hypothetical protein
MRTTKQTTEERSASDAAQAVKAVEAGTQPIKVQASSLEAGTQPIKVQASSLEAGTQPIKVQASSLDAPTD